MPPCNAPSWKKLVRRFAPGAVFSRRADEARLTAVELNIGVRLPVDLREFLLETDVSGPVNLTAPGAVRNADFARYLADLRRLKEIVSDAWDNAPVSRLRSYEVIRFIEERIVASLRAGGFPEVAAQAWGVSPGTFRRWLRRGRRRGRTRRA